MKTVNVVNEAEIWKVKPGELRTRSGEIVSFQADTGSQFIFPTTDLFGVPEIDVEKGHVINLVVQNPNVGTYQYAVYCYEEGKFAIGGSYPRIIITV